jgi:two-component system cell cycle response regulator
MADVPMIIILSAAALAAVTALALALHRISMLADRIRVLESRGDVLDKELAAAHWQAAQAGSDQLQLARFVRELPHVVHELHSTAGARQIPNLLLGSMTRLLEPKKALVAVRRRAVEVDQDRHMRLVVAAAYPAGWIEVGDEIRIGQGEIGFAAEVQRVLDRRDFDNQHPHVRKRLRDETPLGCQPDVVAPMIFKEEVVGVIAVEGVRSPSKDALRLLAQVGAVAVHTQARYVEMKATASIDGLTGIFNKRFLTHRLAEEMRLCLDNATSLSVFIFDVDHFKAYNDRNGHVAGDWLLRELAKLVQECVRRDAVFGRYGGEEFLILFPGASRAQALAAAENVRQAIAAHAFALGADQPLGFISVSGGVAECPIDGLDAASLVRAADDALYKAKAAGRNRVLAHKPTYLGGREPLAPVLAGGVAAPRTRGEPDFTPEPGALLSLASITPAGGLPLLTEQPTPEVLAEALAPKSAPSTEKA